MFGKTEFSYNKKQLERIMKKMATLPRATANKISTKVLSPSMQDMKREMKKSLRSGIKTHGATTKQRLKGQASIANDVKIVSKKRPSKLYFMSGVALKKMTGTGAASVSNNRAKGYAIRGYALRKGTVQRRTKKGQNRGKIVVQGDYFLEAWLPKKPVAEAKAWRTLNEEVSKIK